MIYHPDTSDFPGGEEQFLKDYRPSAGRMFKIGMGAGFDDTLPGLLTSLSEMDQAENQPLLTKEDWEASKFYDPEIKWDDSFTTPKARLLKERRDRERELGFLLDRAGMGATASFYAGALVGTVPDPVNYIPFVGIASKAKSAAVLGKIAQSGRLGRGATTAADAVLGTALIQPLVAAERDTYQLKYDTRDALTELGLALGLGFGLGAALGRVHPKDPVETQIPPGRVRPDGTVEPDNLPPDPPDTPAQQSWDSVAPTDKVEAVRRKIANDAVGTQDNVPIVRQQAAQQAIAQDAARQSDVLPEIPEGATELIEIPVGKSKKLKNAVQRYWYHTLMDDPAKFPDKTIQPSKGNEKVTNELLETEFKDPDPRGFVWLSPKPLDSQNLIVVDVAKLEPSKMRLTGQIEGYAIYNGEIPVEAQFKTSKTVSQPNKNIIAQQGALAEVADDIPNEVWNTPRPEPTPLPAPDDTPISANEARLQQMEAALDERIRTAEANGTLSETDARELAYIDEEIVELDKYHQAVSETIECVIANG